MAGDRGRIAGSGVLVDRVIGAFAPEFAAVGFEVFEELTTLQRVRGSR